MKSSFRIVKRPRPDGPTRFIARFLDPSGKITRSVTIHEARTPAQAAVIAQEMIRKGHSAENPEALSFILQFWTEESEYCQKKARGRQALSLAYLYNSRRVVANHFASVLKDKGILNLTPSMFSKHQALL